MSDSTSDTKWIYAQRIILHNARMSSIKMHVLNEHSMFPASPVLKNVVQCTSVTSAALSGIGFYRAFRSPRDLIAVSIAGTGILSAVTTYICASEIVKKEHRFKLAQVSLVLFQIFCASSRLTQEGLPYTGICDVGT
eukprot:m.1270379 g.1270379  ORF g.1270379 m.1270379 type:complete len:137 (+) comp24749_c0_seq23:1088-1498(+)